MALTASQITDLANNTLAELGKFKIVDIATDIREHVAMSNLMRKNNVEYDSGDAIDWNLLQNGDDNTKNTGLFSRDNTNVKDGTFSLSIPWRHTQTSCAFDVREKAMNRGAAQIVDIVKIRRMQSMIGLVEKMEDNFWQGVSSSADDETPYGLFGYWLDYDATSGFNGSNGNFGTIGGKDADTYTKLKHYTFQYTAVSDTDFVDEAREALVLSKFKPTLTNSPIPGYANGESRVGYCTWTTQKALEKLARSNNDNLGSDLDKFHDTVRIQRVPIREVPWLTENKSTSQPVVWVDWSQFKGVRLKGKWMVDSPFAKKDGQHNVQEMFTDCSYNFRCWDRRKGLILGAKSDPLSA